MKRASGTTLALATLAAAVAAGGAEFHCDPVHGRADGDGSGAHPWRTVEEAIAAGVVEIATADGNVVHPGGRVKSGDTVVLHPGFHGALHLPAGYNESFVTFAAAPGAAAPRVSSVNIAGGRRWRIRGLEISPSYATGAQAKNPDRIVSLGERGDDRTSDLVVEDCYIHSVEDASGWSARDWIDKASSGIWLGRHGRGLVARNNYIRNVRFGIDLCAPDSLCEGNVVENFSADGIRVTRDGQTVRFNVVRNNFVGAGDGDGNHDDAIQAFLFNAGRGLLRNVTVCDNLLVERARPGLPFPNPLQGIGFFDGPLTNFVVAGNVALVGSYHGVSLYDAQGCTIRSNVCFNPGLPGGHLPWLMIGGKRGVALGNTVQDNFAHSFSLKADPEVQDARNALVSRDEANRRTADLARAIDGRFGRLHAAAARLRFPDGFLSGIFP